MSDKRHIFPLLGKYHEFFYIAGLGLIIISLPLSQFVLSVGQFILVGNWLLEGNFKKKYKTFLSNKAAIILVSLFLLHVAGLIYTTDLNYALKDLRIKLPLLALPVIFSTTQPIQAKKFDVLMWLFIGASVVASAIGFGILIFKEIRDIREISPFISHIRLSLNICLAIFFSGYFLVVKYRDHVKYQAVSGMVIFWLVSYLIFSESATGIYVLLTGLLIIVIWAMNRFPNQKIKRIVISVTIIIPFLLGAYIFSVSRDYLTPHKNDLKNLEYFTSYGNEYSHDTIHYNVENGSYIGIYVCDEELHESWSKRSEYDYLGKDENGQELKMTLVRYLNSKGLRKDAGGVNQLMDRDIRNIESGIANYYYARKFNLNARIYKFLWEYQTVKRGLGYGGLSLAQRFEYWRAATGIIRDYPWFGVGTGDMDEAFKIQYEKMKTNLPVELRHRSHNQFLAIATAFGLLGLSWFIFTLVYPPIQLRAFRNFRYLAFFIVLILSMFFEDTLETQIGATLFGFFNAFLLFVHEDHLRESSS